MWYSDCDVPVAAAHAVKSQKLINVFCHSGGFGGLGGGTCTSIITELPGSDL